MTRLAAALLVTVLLVAACSSDGAQSEPPSTAPAASASSSEAVPSAPPSAPGTASRSATPDGGATPPAGAVWLPEWADETTPDAVRDRAPLHFCGVEQAPAPVPGEHIDAVVRACFWDAWQNDAPAEFVSVQSTMEGAPFATIWRTNGDGTLDLLVDMTQDSLGSGGWSVTRCRALVEDTEGNAFFGPSDCEESQALG